jgi:hypothetical protein
LDRLAEPQRRLIIRSGSQHVKHLSQAQILTGGGAEANLANHDSEWNIEHF